MRTSTPDPLAIAIQADVSKVADIDRLFAAWLERFGRLDIAVPGDYNPTFPTLFSPRRLHGLIPLARGR